MSLRVPKPMLATLATELPTGAAWTYEVKFDGYRTLAVKDGNRVTLYSRNLKDATRQFAPIAQAVASIPVRATIFDGELVAVDADGQPSFQALHHQEAHHLAYYLFDLLHLDGHDLTRESLRERRKLLEATRLDSPIFVPIHFRALLRKSSVRCVSSALRASSRSGSTRDTSRVDAVARGSR